MKKKTKTEQMDKIERITNLISAAITANKSELLNERQALVVWLRDECPEKPTFTVISNFF